MRKLRDRLLAYQNICVIGCGGKSTLIEAIAESAEFDKSVLITPTTQMLPPDMNLTLLTADELPSKKMHTGVFFSGSEIPERKGKYRTLSPERLEKVTPFFDHVLMEGDGSNSHPLKGYRSGEPEVPEWSNLVLKVAPFSVIGKRISEETVLRLPLFLNQVGGEVGDEVSPAIFLEAQKNLQSFPYDIEKIPTVLWINHVMRETEFELVRKMLLDGAPHPFSAVVAGDLMTNIFEIIEGDV